MNHGNPLLPPVCTIGHYSHHSIIWFITIGLCRNNEDSFVDNLMLGVQLADVSTRCSSHPQGKSEARCEIDGNL